MSGYRAALNAPGIARVVAAVLVCYLLAGMVNLSLLLSAAHSTGSYAVAGLVVGAYSTAVAVAAPIWGRVVDRRGPVWTLAVTSLSQTAAFAGYITAVLTQAPALVLVGAAATAGSLSPPSSSIAKKVFALTGDSDNRRALFAISGLFAETVFVIGPLVVGGIVAVAPPVVAVSVTAAVSLIGVWWLRGASALRSIDENFESAAGSVDRRSSTLLRGIQARILAVVVLGAVAIGALQVSVVVRAGDLGVNAGLFVAALASGGVVASLVYGGISLPGSLPAQLAVCLGMYGVFILTLAAEPGVVLSVLLLVLAGAATGPADAMEALLIAEHTPVHGQSHAFAALTTANWLGFAIGSAAAGAVVEISLLAGVGLAAGAALLAALSLALSRGHPEIRAA
ncbi:MULTISPECIES: MFS transporter [unclassified Kribbella]|uniref:MFS transporter n=1 Tax=unclassified Kribbella TaxID=2644121 RepID=UPI00301B3DFE